MERAKGRGYRNGNLHSHDESDRCERHETEKTNAVAALHPTSINNS